MSLQLALRRVLDTAQSTFRSVDIRTFFTCLNDINYNVTTSIGFNQEPADSLTDAIIKHLRSLPHFESERLKFSFKVVAIEKWPDLVEEFKAGRLESSNVLIDLMRPIDLMDIRGYVNSVRYLSRNPNWPAFESVVTWNAPQNEPGSIAMKLHAIQHDPEILLNLHANGYRDLKDLFHGFLQSRPDADPSYTSAIYVSVPVYARIHEIKFSPRETASPLPSTAIPTFALEFRFMANENPYPDLENGLCSLPLNTKMTIWFQKQR